MEDIIKEAYRYFVVNNLTDSADEDINLSTYILPNKDLNFYIKKVRKSTLIQHSHIIHTHIMSSIVKKSYAFIHLIVKTAKVSLLLAK